MTGDDTIRGTGGHFWTTGEDERPAHAIPFDKWEFTPKSPGTSELDLAVAPGGTDQWAKRLGMWSGCTGSISGFLDPSTFTVHRVPGRRKALRMRKRGY